MEEEASAPTTSAGSNQAKTSKKDEGRKRPKQWSTEEEEALPQDLKVLTDWA